MSSFDLHIHSTYSDGTFSPEQIVTEAAANSVTLIAITDHDEIAGLAVAAPIARELGVQLISGVEINTEIGREEVHILGYGFDENSPLMLEGLQRLRESRQRRMAKMLARLNDIGCPISAVELQRIAGHGSIGRPHLAQALLAAGYVTSISDAFNRYIGNRSPAYIPRESITPEAAIALIHQSGGIASLAHPGKLGDPVRIIERLRATGLDALEVYHSDHQVKMTQRLLARAQQYRLIITGGSDSHGTQGIRNIAIGNVNMPESVRNDFLFKIAANLNKTRT